MTRYRGLVIGLFLCLISQVMGADSMPAPSEREIETAVYAARPPPLRDFTVTRTIQVSDYGVLPDDGRDALPGIQLALADALKVSGPVKLLFKKGRYLLNPYQSAKPPKPGAHCLEIVRRHDLILDGAGSDFVVQNPFVGFIKIEGCERVIVKNFSVDYDPLPVLQADILAADPGTGVVTIHISDGFPDFSAPYIDDTKPSRTCGTLYETATRKMKPDVRTGGWFWFNGRSVVSSGPREYKISLETKADASAFAKGDSLVMWNNRRPIGIVRTNRSSDVTVMNVTAYSSPNTAFSGFEASQMNLLDCKLLPKPGRMTTTNADSFTIFGGARIGPWMEGCDFENVIDDICQNEGFRFTVATVVSNRQLTTDHPHTITPDELRPGDTILFFNMKDATPFFEARVEKMDYASRTITFDRDLPLSKIFPASPTEKTDITILFNKSHSASNFVIKNNVFKNGVGNGIISNNPKSNGIIEGNRFENIYASSVGFMNHASPTYFPGLAAAVPHSTLLRMPGGGATNETGDPAFAENILIRGNYFSEGQGGQSTFLGQGAISFFFYGLGWQETSKAIGFKNIIIKENTFENIPRALAIHISNARDVLIEGNKFSNSVTNPYMASLLEDKPIADKILGLIGISNSYSIRVKDNKAVEQGKLVPFLYLGKDTHDIRTSNNVITPTKVP